MNKKFQFSGSIRKADAKRGIVYAEIYVPDRPDTQSDFATAATIEKAAHGFMAAGRADHIDYEHDLKKTGSVAVESFIASEGNADGFTPGAWVLGIKPDKVNAARIERGEVRGVSLYGSGKRVPVQKDGKTFNELHGLDVQAVSWVRKPANRTQGAQFISKSDPMANAPPWARTLVENASALFARIEANDAQIAEIKASTAGQSSTSDVRKAETDARIVELRKSHAILSDQLERLWSAEGSSLFEPGYRRQKEAELVVELDRVERELETLQKSGIDFDARGRSAFATRGGVSERIRLDSIFPGGDSAFEAKPESVSKHTDGRPHSTLKL